MKLWRNLTWVWGAFALSTQAGAATLTEADFLVDLPMVLSASRLSQPLTHTPAAVTIIDQDMIRASGFRDIPDLFRLVPGFTVAFTGSNSWGVGYHGIADDFSRRMQVLIDGRSVYLPGFGQTPWSILPLSIEDIDHIEIVRGPNAAVYGPNAFFGVINIITKDPSQAQGFHASVQAGQQSNSGGLLRYGSGNGDFRYRLTLSDQRRDRFDNQADKTDTRNLDFRGDYRLSNTDELTFNIAASRGDWKLGETGNPFDPVRDTVNVGSEQFQAKFRRVIDQNTEWSLQFYHLHTFIDDAFLALGFFPVDYSQEHWRNDVEFQMTNGINSKTRLVWGAEARWEGADAGKSYFYGMDARTGVQYRLFGNLEWIPDEKWVVNGGVMAEHHYYTGMDYSPRLAVNYLISPDHALRASVGQAYRTPTFFEVESYYPGIYSPAGSLDTEKITSREIGYFGHIRSLNLSIDARLFNDAVRKLIGHIDVLPGPGKIFQSANKHFANLRGGDLQLKWKPTRDIDLTLNYARVSIDSDDEDISQSAPKNNFSALAVYRLPDGWEASAGVYKVGYMKWLSGGDTNDAFTRVDLRLAKRWKLQGHPMELSMVGQNLGGGRYQEFRPENQFDRRAYVGLAFDW